MSTAIITDGAGATVWEVGEGASISMGQTLVLSPGLRQYGYLNVKHHTYFKPGEYACTPANQALLASGEVVPVYVPA